MTNAKYQIVHPAKIIGFCPLPISITAINITNLNLSVIVNRLQFWSNDFQQHFALFFEFCMRKFQVQIQ